MPYIQWTAYVVVAGASLLTSKPAQTQQSRDSSIVSVDSAPPTWQDSARYGGGPSVGAAPSDYTGATPPSQWCLQATRRAQGDLGVSPQSWTNVSRSWLSRVLSDTTRHGVIWRQVLGGAPVISPGDSIVQVTDEETCHEIAELLNREVLGWRVGPPPGVVLRVKDFLIAYPSNARRGEWGLAVGMSLEHRIRGVALW